MCFLSNFFNFCVIQNVKEELQEVGLQLATEQEKVINLENKLEQLEVRCKTCYLKSLYHIISR